nr:hypothetical protein [Tanacetum cinerariifolium]
MIVFVKESGCPNATKVNNTANARKPTVKYAEMYKNTSKSPRVRRNQRNWNNQKSQQLGKDFMMQNKACYNCGSFDHLEFNCKHDICVDKGKTWTRVNHAQDNMKYTSTHKTKNKVWALTVRQKIPTVGSKVLAAKPTVDADKRNKGKVVKASARWIWKPKKNSSGQALNFNGVSGIPQDNIDDKGYWDSGCSRHMTGNISYLSEYEPFNGGNVSFGHGRGKINGKSSIKTDETSRILRNFITEIQNLKDLNVKIIRSDNGGEFRNKEMDEFCSRKGIKREFTNARTPQQNGVVKRRNRTLIEAARTMLADAKLHVTFWAAVNTASYVQNRVLVIKPHNKTPYELFNERSPAIGFLKPFGCHVMILNTLDYLGKFDAKEDEGYFVGYSLSSKAFRVFNKRTKKIEENLHLEFLKNRSIEKGTGLDWLFNIDTLTNSMNYVPVVVAGSSSTNISAAKKDDVIPDNNAPQKEQEEVNGDKEVPENNRNSNPTASTKVSTNDSFELTSSSTVETEVPIVSTSVLTGSLFVPLVTSSIPRIISKGGLSFPKLLSLGNAMSFKNRLEDFFRDTIDAVSLNDVEADLSNMETAIQEEGIDYEEVFAPVSRIEAIRLFLAYASYIGFTVYEMDVKSAFLYETIIEEVYVMQPPGFQDHEFPHRVYKVEKAMYGLHQAPKAWYGTLSKYLLDNGFQRGLQVLQKKDGIFLSQDTYVGDILKKIRYTDIRLVKTPMDRENPWGKDGTSKDVELHLYRSMIGSLMYLTASRLNIMFAVCTCARHQVTPKECHLYAVKRILDNDYGGANQDRKSTTGGCQFLGRRLISWQCKKQTIVATFTTEAEYVAAASGCG